MPRLLIIDDNANIRHLMRSYIEQAGHIVCGEAQDGVEGVELAKRTDPDLILLDFVMPALTGAETAALLKQAVPHIPIILFTLHGEEINKHFAAAMGVDMVVNKADGIPKIAESVKTLLARKTKLPARTTASTTKGDGARPADSVSQRPANDKDLPH
jgi:DNA-binding NarL/FixJ family response regulator